MTHPDIKSWADTYYGRTSAAFFGLSVTFLALFFHYPEPWPGAVIGADFVNTWMGARRALEGQPQEWFDTNVYNAALREMFGETFPEHHWSYPPHLLLVTWPLGFLAYFPAFVVWCGVGFALYVAVAAQGDRRGDRLLMLVAAPAIVMNIISGQKGFFTAGLLIGGLSLLDRRPIVSGILFGVLTMKPQLGLLLPLMLLLKGQWRCIISATVTTLILVGVTGAIFGADVWPRFFSDSVPTQSEWLTHGSGIFPSMMPTAFMNARITGLPADWAWVVQAPVSIAAIAALTWTCWRQRDPVLSTALFLTASFLVTPYAFHYDMIVFGWVLAQLRDHEGSQRLDHHLAIAVWTLPAWTVLLGYNGIPISCPVLIAFGARLIWRMARDETSLVPREFQFHASRP